MKKIIISGCLVGENCKYNGKSNYNPFVKELSKRYELVLICPEQMGGLPTPRSKSEIKGDHVVFENGTDVTRYFAKGAKEVLNIVKYLHIDTAILMERSPSCGVHHVYNGNFDGTLIDGQGFTTKLLRENGVTCYTIEEFEELLKNENENN